MKLELSDTQAEILCHFLEETLPRGNVTGMERPTRITYDIFQVLRKAIADKRCYPPSDTWHNPPLHTCRTEPLARVEP